MFVMIHHIKPSQIYMLEGIFAKLTANGWIIPQWIEILRINLELED